MSFFDRTVSASVQRGNGSCRRIRCRPSTASKAVRLRTAHCWPVRPSWRRSPSRRRRGVRRVRRRRDRRIHRNARPVGGHGRNPLRLDRVRRLRRDRLVRRERDRGRLERRRPHAFASRGSHGRHHRQRREAERLDNFQQDRKHAHHLAHHSRRQHDKGCRRRGAYWRRRPPLPRGEAPLSGFAAGREAASL